MKTSEKIETIIKNSATCPPSEVVQDCMVHLSMTKKAAESFYLKNLVKEHAERTNEYNSATCSTCNLLSAGGKRCGLYSPFPKVEDLENSICNHHPKRR